jgi:ABC-type sugar transport system substrate-binding protein
MVGRLNLPSQRSRGRTALAVFLLAMLAGVLPACNGSDRSAATGKPPLGLIVKSLANEFFLTMADGAKKHHAAHGADCDFIVNGIKNETDLTEQVGLVEQMIAQQVNTIVITLADSKALVPVLRRAKDAGVLVVNIDNKLDTAALKEAGLSVPFVGPDKIPRCFEAISKPDTSRTERGHSCLPTLDFSTSPRRTRISALRSVGFQSPLPPGE